MTFNYWTDIWQPMTRQHYERGGVYREVTYQRDERGNVAAVMGRVLTVDEAVERRHGTLEVVYKSSKPIVGKRSEAKKWQNFCPKPPETMPF